ncbi:Emsy N Terminus (ENT)/ plant Tudor-like domains-containing protein [Heracleum sosnowskyi]|uniref:Emsy N Terminus (ENT)/ plant Tudor-like domains-containing protein n=1 Tax=Heracleum sosnowskyi TaxID=360622 RepID=A0AAD8N0Z2_9APIA|nr:Emsy N Terminus (ENT)/ plant Tudor-like domains-containing protein [Heracleum sosnowskyi]
MDYNPNTPVGGNYSGTGRFAMNPSTYSKMQFDMESQIHQLEQEAYRSVLRAFKAQSDAISWEKEGLITELRKELRVSDDEHRELLSTVNTDEVICTIREWRKASETQTGMFGVSQAMHNMLPSPTFSESWKKQKTTQSGSLAYSRQMQGSFNQQAHPSPEASKWAPSFEGPQMPGLSGRYPSTVPTPRGVSNGNGASSLLVIDTNVEVARREQFIGRKVMIRWPQDNNFYEAIITDYNPQKDHHALVYDRNTPKEALEWVDLKDISSEDIRWVGEDPGLSHQSVHGMQSNENPKNHGSYPNSEPGEGAMRDQNEIEIPFLEDGVVKKSSDEIEILHTETLIKEVQKMFTSSHPDMLEIEKAKKTLKEHEEALMNIISKLSNASYSGRDAEQISPHVQSMDGVQRLRTSQNSGNSHGPCLEAETTGGKANGPVVAKKCLNQQEDEIIEI